MSGSEDHVLVHRQIHDSLGPRLTPGCSCGWWSPDGSHYRFEMHLRSARGGEPDHG